MGHALSNISVNGTPYITTCTRLCASISNLSKVAAFTGIYGE